MIEEMSNKKNKARVWNVYISPVSILWRSFIGVLIRVRKGSAYLAQSVERKTFNLVAEGSTPSVGRSKKFFLVSLGG